MNKGISLLLAHELALAGAGTLAILAAWLSGELAMYVGFVLFVPSISALLHLKERPLSALWATAIAFMALLLGVTSFLQGGLERSVVAALEGLLGILAARSLRRTTRSHDVQTLLLALLVLFGASVVNFRLNYGVIFVAFGLCVVWALLGAELLGGVERDAQNRKHVDLYAGQRRKDIVTPGFLLGSASAALLILMLSSLVFVVFPRVGLGKLLSYQSKSRLLPGVVSLTDAPRLSQTDTETLARVYGLQETDYNKGLYLRGLIYNTLSEQGFLKSTPKFDRTIHRQDWLNFPERRRYEIYQQPLAGELILSLGPVAMGRVLGSSDANVRRPLFVQGLGKNSEVLLNRAPAGAVRVSLVGGIGGVDVSNDVHPLAADTPYLQMPESLQEVLGDLSTEIVGEAQSAPKKVSALVAFFKDNFSYTLNAVNQDKAEPLKAFLLSDRRGHCEYFATGLAALLRAQNIPSRVIGGFQGGYWDPRDKVAIFSSEHGHAWAEWYDEEKGWLRVDATPPSFASSTSYLSGYRVWVERMQRYWDDYVIDYNFNVQLEIVRALTPEFKNWNRDGEKLSRHHALYFGYGFLALLICVGIGYTVWRRRQGGNLKVHPLAKELLKLHIALSKKDASEGQTLREVVQATQNVLHAPQGEELSVLLEQTLELYEQERFAGRPSSKNRHQGQRQRLHSALERYHRQSA
ncbi:MAG: transglutaminaseTgpA domain-containing protein [Myxococcota bacterium]|jgi:hypothetical protein|nr:transglutaminaseTgpA domain-containing protein [Myxococcota bacterium]